MTKKDLNMTTNNAGLPMPNDPTIKVLFAEYCETCPIKPDGKSWTPCPGNYQRCSFYNIIKSKTTPKGKRANNKIERIHFMARTKSDVTGFQSALKNMRKRVTALRECTSNALDALKELEEKAASVNILTSSELTPLFTLDNATTETTEEPEGTPTVPKTRRGRKPAETTTTPETTENENKEQEGTTTDNPEG